MPVPHRAAGDCLEGRRILCRYEKIKNPVRVGTAGKDNAQRITIKGKKQPAYAVINQILYWVK
jgi:hypothetical protein